MDFALDFESYWLGHGRYGHLIGNESRMSSNDDVDVVVVALVVMVVVVVKGLSNGVIKNSILQYRIGDPLLPSCTFFLITATGSPPSLPTPTVQPSSVRLALGRHVLPSTNHCVPSRPNNPPSRLPAFGGKKIIDYPKIGLVFRRQ